MTTKQHQLLAVEPTREAAATKQITECTNTFSKKPELFSGETRLLSLFDQSPERMIEIQALEAKDKIAKDVQYTVAENLNYMAGVVGQWLNVNFQKELTNQKANADVIIDGVTIIPGAPATYLLGLETKLNKLRDLYMAMPTLAPGLNWATFEGSNKQNVYRTPEDTNVKTETTKSWVQHKQTSDKHPDTFTEQSALKNIGTYTSRKFSGMMSVADKAAIIARLDKLLMAIKEARCKANEVDAAEDRCAGNIFKFLHGNFHNDEQVASAAEGKSF